MTDARNPVVDLKEVRDNEAEVFDTMCRERAQSVVAEVGPLQAIVLITVEKDGAVSTYVEGEHFALLGALYQAAHRMMDEFEHTCPPKYMSDPQEPETDE